MKNKYHIIITRDNKQVEFIGFFRKESKANAKFHQLVKESENVKFPVKYINIDRSIIEANYEIVLIKYREEGESSTTLLRNEYGEFVEHETNNKNWIVYDKAPYYKEETFWVYGYHPLIQRKNFDFIFENIVKAKAMKKDTMLNIMVYKNKLLFETTNNLDLVICKNHSDCIRLYNTIEEESKKIKLKFILFNGDWNTRDKSKIIVEKIKKLTNWNDLKIKRTSTRP